MRKLVALATFSVVASLGAVATVAGTASAMEPTSVIEQAIVDRQEMVFLYFEDGGYVFMNTSTYDQTIVPGAALGSAADYLVEQAVAQVAWYRGQIIGVEIPASVELTVAQTEPGVQGDRVPGARKPAVLETGKTVQVPLFVEAGDRITVDTRTGEYIGRV